MPAPYHHCSNCGAADLAARSDREFVCVKCGYRHFITPIPAACALIVDREKRLLILRRGHEPGLGKLGLPGGVIEPGETGEVAAARETREEVGLDLPPSAFKPLVTLPNRYHFQDYLWPTLDLFYIAEVETFPPLKPDPTEVSEWFLLTLDQIPLEDFAFESNAEAVRLFGDGKG